MCNRGCGHAVDRRQSSQNFLEIRRASTVVNMYILRRVYTRVNIKMPPLVIYAGCEGSDISVLLRYVIFFSAMVATFLGGIIPEKNHSN